ncbi:MAG: hypothetical protein RIC19_11965 [Phaeodactylibacter sp.]
MKLCLRNRHNRQPPNTHKRHFLQLRIGFDGLQGDGLGKWLDGGHVYRTPIAFFSCRVRIGFAYHFADARYLKPFAAVVKQDKIAHPHAAQVIAGGIIAYAIPAPGTFSLQVRKAIFIRF